MDYVELQTTSNFSFLRGASHPQELVATAAELGHKAIAITDRNSFAGVVRAHAEAKKHRIQYILGATVEILCSTARDLENTDPPRFTFLIYPTSVSSYHSLSQLLTTGKRRSREHDCLLTLYDLIAFQKNFVLIAVPPTLLHNNKRDTHTQNSTFLATCQQLLEATGQPELFSLALTKNYGHQNHRYLKDALQMAKSLGVKPVATNDVHYHHPHRKPLQDVLACIREKTTVQNAGRLLFPNRERCLKPPQEMYRLFQDLPESLHRGVEIAEICSSLSLHDLHYEYPHEICPDKQSPLEHLTDLTWQGAQERYPDGTPSKVVQLIQDELKLIHELGYEKYFLTCHDIVRFARSRNILCQGRGAAANSAVCYCLGITAVNPDQIDILFARFVSKERCEPPDIDIDFEHERREEIIQYIYQKYGRERAALTCEVITYRYRSAIRDVGKALGLPVATVDRLAKSIYRWTGCVLPEEALHELGLHQHSTIVQNTLQLSQEIRSFPRHLSQHVGGFIISEDPLSSIVPIRNATMENRTIIEWDKDDIEELQILKIDVLGLGMLTCIRKALSFINRKKRREGASELTLYNIPREDPAVYDMICNADTVGVFQIESRAQMSMLPRLKPRCFYDLVIEVAIVRPGPIQGKMVHPYLRRRAGLEKPFYPDERAKQVLGKTLGVPIFQEQAMRLAIELANFAPGEAEMLRRAMAAWKRNKTALEAFEKRIMNGMKENGYSESFAERCIQQLHGFSEYGFPESHAASFAVLVYASAWIKHYYPAEFAAALMNSQPMGFYSPSQIVSDAKRHGVEVLPVDINESEWDCTVHHIENGFHTTQQLRLGFRLIKGLRRSEAEHLTETVRSYGAFSSIDDLWKKAHTSKKHLRKQSLYCLARADAFYTICSRREALWQIRALPENLTLLDPQFRDQTKSTVQFKQPSLQQEMFQDYATTRLSLRSHPFEFVRAELASRNVLTATTLRDLPKGREQSRVTTAGLVLFRQRPRTAKGVVFMTLEDETGVTNLIIQSHIFSRYQKTVLMSAALMACGKLQRVGSVVYISVQKLESLDTLVLSEKLSELPSRSYAY